MDILLIHVIVVIVWKYRPGLNSVRLDEAMVVVALLLMTSMEKNHLVGLVVVVNESCWMQYWRKRIWMESF